MARGAAVTRWALRAGAECAVVVAAAGGIAAAVDPAVSAATLTLVFLVPVLVVAVRHGLVAGLIAAVAGALTLNWFFIPPVHALNIRDSSDVAALVAFLAVAAVTGRLVSAARAREAEAAERARVAEERGHEAELLAAVAATLLRGQAPASHLDEVSEQLAAALGAPFARISLSNAPDPRPGEREVGIPRMTGRAWVHVPEQDAARVARDGRRVLRGLGTLLDVAADRDRISARAGEAEAARRADAAKTAVLHTISHDLRSPLTAISAAGDALAGWSLSDDERAELAGVVREEAARLTRIVDDLLDLSRIEAGAVAPRIDWVDLRDVVASAAGQLPTTHVRIELPQRLPLVRADAVQLERVFVNLLDNAARFSPPGRPVRVTGGVGGGSVTVRVLDDGPGVPAHERATIFEPFHKGRRGAGGAGLGLAIVRGFVEAVGGRVNVQARPQGGTAFAVSLPLVEQPAAA
jgi:two-component system sensor histidine kinase KdpD